MFKQSAITKLIKAFGIDAPNLSPLPAAAMIAAIMR